MYSTKETFLAALLFLAVISIPIGIWITTSHFEAKAYNHVTGKNVSTWDAMWIELRVQEGSKE